MRQRWLLTSAVAVMMLAAFAAGVFLSGQRPAATGSGQPDPATIEKLLATSFTDLQGRPATLSSWRGKPLIVNFWATWCPPCLKEIPLFSRLQEGHPNVQFIGIAVDKPGNVRDFVANRSLSYPILIASDGAVSLMSELGNGRNGLPFTLSIDAGGHPRHAKLGALSETETERIVADLSGG